MRTTKELREDYRRMDGTWPRPLPPVTFDELKSAYRKMRKKFRSHRPNYKMRFTKTSGNRESRSYLTSDLNGPQYLRVILNPDRGWDDFVHWLSHVFAGGHHEGHLKTEWAMIKYVRNETDWLAGGLRRPDKPEQPKPSRVEQRAAKARRNLERAEAAFERARKRCSKWTARVRYYERRTLTATGSKAEDQSDRSNPAAA